MKRQKDVKVEKTQGLVQWFGLPLWRKTDHKQAWHVYYIGLNSRRICFEKASR